MSTVNVKRPRCLIDGMVLLDKPKGLSSNQALQRVKHLVNAKKAGHTGSLDPLATGLLPICLGQATKFSQYLLDANKKYRVVIRLGVRTTTSDAEGEVVAVKDVSGLSREQLDVSLNAFRGEIDQVPSMYSALKYQGTPLYRLARQGITVDRPSRRITIYDNVLVDVTGHDVTLDVYCSKGTYIRTLADDWGELLGCGAHVIALRRTQVGAYLSDAMVTLPVIEQGCLADRSLFLQQYVLKLSSAVAHLPRCDVLASEVLALQRGQRINKRDMAPCELVAVHGPGGFVGVGSVQDGGWLKVKRLLSYVGR